MGGGLPQQELNSSNLSGVSGVTPSIADYNLTWTKTDGPLCTTCNESSSDQTRRSSSRVGALDGCCPVARLALHRVGRWAGALCQEDRGEHIPGRSTSTLLSFVA